MDLKSLRTQLQKLQGSRVTIEQYIDETRTRLQQQKRNLRYHTQAREIVREVGRKTQEQLRFHISDITSLALVSIFDDPYELTVDFTERRNQTECDLWFERNGYRIRPLEAAGLGSVDVAGFALRVASWSMKRPRTRNVLLMDEPFKHLKGLEENLRVIQMVKELSKHMGLQVIMVHDERVPFEEIERGADRVFRTSQYKGKTKIETL